MKKRLISWLLCAAILVGLIPGTAVFALATEPDAETIFDDYISVSVSRKNGGFTIRTAEGDQLKKSDNNKKLLYHDGQYDTSFLSLRIGEGEGAKDYLFGGKYANSGDVTVTRATAGDRIDAVWTVDGMTVTQTVSLTNEDSDESGMIAIGVTVTNQSGTAVPVAARLLLDTSLGEQDYGFYQYTDSSHNAVTIQQERVIEETETVKVPQQLYAADDVYSPTVMAYSVHTGERPYRAAFGHWNHLAATLFDFKPSTNLNFTESDNEYLTADSACAFWYDLGTVANGESGSMSTYYGVYSNHQIPAEDSVAINLTAPTRLKLNEDKDGFASECNVGVADFSVAVDFANIASDTAQELKQISLAVQCSSNLRSLNDLGQPMDGQDYGSATAHTYSYQNVAVGQSIGKTLYFDAKLSNDAHYEKVIIGVYDVSQTNGVLSDTYKLGERIAYILLPGSDGNVPKVNFAAMTPKIVYNEGTRHLFVTVGNETLLEDTDNWSLKAYREKENEEDTESILIPHSNITINDGVMDVALTEDMELAVGGWYLQLEWQGGAIGTVVEEENAKQSAPELHFTVSDDKQYKNDSYGVLAIVEYNGDGENTNKKKYKICPFRDEDSFTTFQKKPAEYKPKYENERYETNYSEIVFVFKGEFTATKKNGDVGTYYTAVSTKEKKDGKWVVDNPIIINDCLDFEDGTMTVYYEGYNSGNAPFDTAVCTEFDGKLYTNKERTSVWTGRAAITKLEQNKANYSLAPYDENGERISVKNDSGTLKAGDESDFTDQAICLMWPSVAKIGQTLAGLLVHLMYGQFGRMYDTDGYGKIEDEIGTVISFAAALDLTFASDVGPGTPPDTYWSKMQELWAECRDESPYVCQADFERYFNARNWSTVDEKAEDKTKQEATASVAVRDILFGCGKGFVGVNFTVGVTINNYVNELPGIEGSISVNTVNNWSYGIDGKIDLEVFCVEATVSFRSKNNVPVPDEFYVFVSGFEPGINIDGLGVCWITGGGGGIKNLYDTIFCTKKVPPLKLLLSVSFDIIKVLECKKATLSLGATGIGISANDIGIKVLPGFTAIEKMGLSLEWYPGIDMRANIVVNLFQGVIYGGGYMVLLSSNYKDYFFEMFARAQLRVPASVPVAGGMTIGGADLGINTEKIWGAIDVLFITLGVTYYWGESGVDFSSGSKTQPTFPELLGYEDIPVGYDTESGRTLYARVGTNTQLMASNLEDDGGVVLMAVTGASVTSNLTKQTHTLTLPALKGDSDALVQISFDAESKEKAEEAAENIKVGSSEGASDYTLTLYDGSNLKTANANLTYDETTGRATYAFTVTDSEDYGKTWYLTTPEGSDVLLYNVAAVPEVTTVSGTVSGDTATLTWDGKELSELDKISFYLCETKDPSGSDAGYRIGAVEAGTTLAGKTTLMEIPDDVPSGTYYLRAVYSKSDEVNGVVFSEDTLTWNNSHNPTAKISSVRASGDLQYTLTLQQDADTDGYLVTVYNEDGSVTDFERVSYTAEESGDTVIAVGGSYTTIDPEDNSKTKTFGLTGGKRYVIGVTPYHTVAQGTGEAALYGAEVKTAATELPVPVTPTVTFSADQTPKTRTVQEYGMTASETVGEVDVNKVVYTTDTLTLTATVNEAVSGTWNIDDGEDYDFTNTNTVTMALSDLQDGEHTVTVTGEAADGDGFLETYTFITDTLPPQLLLASPVNGSFFGEDGTVTLTGTCDADARFTVTCDGETVCEAQPIAALSGTVNQVGEFAVTLSLPNPNRASQQTLEIAVSDDVGNATEPIRMTLSHGALADIAELEVMVNDKTYANGNIPIPATGLSDAKLTLVGITNSGTKFNLTGYNVDWEVRTVEGSATVSEGIFHAEAMSQGMLTAKLAVSDKAARSAAVSFGAPVGKTVAVSSNIGGSVSGGGEYEAGTTVTLTATPDSGYRFVGWTLLGAESADTTSATLTFVMPSGNVTAEARFAANASPTAPTVSGGGGSVGGIGNGRYAQKGETAEVALPLGKSEAEYLPYYYDENRKQVFVPISAVVDGKVKFIAPKSGQYFFGPHAVSFGDIGGRWSENNILFAAQRDIFKGTGDGVFDPEGAMDRTMVITVLYRLAGSPGVSGTSSYTDVEPGSWYHDAVLWGEEKGIVQGYGDGVFGVGDVITREQLCTMLTRFCDVMNYSLPTVGESEAFADADSISDWAAEAVDYCKTRGLVNGVPGGAFAPADTCTREECSAVMERMIRSLLGSK